MSGGPFAEEIAKCRALLTKAVLQKEPHLREDALMLDARVEELLAAVVAGVVEGLGGVSGAGDGDERDSR